MRIALLTCLVVASLTGCAFSRGAAMCPLTVAADLDSASYRPGQAVICTVALINTGKRDVSTAALQSNTLQFFYGPVGTDVRLAREPVRSSLEADAGAVTLHPGAKVERKFVFTQVAEEAGRYALHAFYRQTFAGDTTSSVIAPAVLFKVEGEPVFHRDAKGVLLKEEALRIAKEKAGSNVAKSESTLIRNEAGFLEWWVTVELATEGGPAAVPSAKGFLVNPYTGAIRVEARPHAQQDNPTEAAIR